MPTKPPVPRASAAWRAEIHARLLAWYDVHRRDLPWRRDTDAYRVWVSEVMLQQIRVAHAAPYFEGWIRRFPTVQSLAGAAPDDLLKAWEGLGLYARVGRMKEAAASVVAEHGGRFPADFGALLKLPGVGRYTAGMVASIAFGIPAPAVDGNVRRVLSRVFDLRAPTPADLEASVASLHRPARPGDFNQALIELGALVCLPRNPRCGACPVAELCRARARGVQARRGLTQPRPVPPHDHVAVALAIRPDGRHLLVRGAVPGLWEFPGAVVRDGESPADAAARALGSDAGPGTPLGTFAHAVSGRTFTYHVFAFAARADAPGAWATGAEIRASYALSRAQQRIAALSPAERANPAAG